MIFGQPSDGKRVFPTKSITTITALPIVEAVLVFLAIPPIITPMDINEIIPRTISTIISEKYLTSMSNLALYPNLATTVINMN